MALQVWDGYDHYNTQTDMLNRSGRLQYGVFNNAGVTLTSPGREGTGKCISIHSGTVGGSIPWVFYQRVASAFVGFGANWAAGQYPIVLGFADSVVQKTQVTIMFRFDNYSITAFGGNATYLGSIIYGDGTTNSTQLAITGNNAFTPGVWNFIEVWPTINGSTGALVVRINNQTIFNLSNVDTEYSGNAWWDTFFHTSKNFSDGAVLVDDFYYGDTTTGPGTYPATSPIGDCHVTTLFPVGNNSVQFTPLANTNWQEVSETAMDSDVSYNYDSTVGNEDTLNFGSLPSGISVIYGIQITGAYRKDDSGARQVKQALKSSSTEVYGTTWTLSETNYVYFTDQWILDPHTSANWTSSGINALAAGYNVAS